ncbi:MAG: adenylyltransferase/cytidyltransferase family protein [Patescibacteria group bacterium]
MKKKQKIKLNKKKNIKKVTGKSSSKKGKKAKLKKVVMVSGGFDPIHIGHVRYFQEAKKLGDKLVVVINNDNWYGVKGRPVFMPDQERKEIIEALACVDEVILSGHPENTNDISVCREIMSVKPHIFANGGDRFADNIPEFKLCNELGIEMVFNVGQGGKVRSSSELLKAYKEKLK